VFLTIVFMAIIFDNVMFDNYRFVVVVVGVFLIGTPSSHRSRLPQIVHRKLFHILALLLFVPPLLLDDPLFLSLSIAIALALSLLMECIRMGRVVPCGATLHRYIALQIDGRYEFFSVV